MKYLVLVIVNLLLIWFSWKISLKAKRYHGIPRFVVFEGIVLLIFFNYPVWFQDAFSLRQMASWVLLIGSLSIAIWALVNYFTHGKPKDRFEETVHIVNTGIYSVIRHPMYFSLLLFAYGAFLKNPNILNHGLSLGVL